MKIKNSLIVREKMKLRQCFLLCLVSINIFGSNVLYKATGYTQDSDRTFDIVRKSSSQLCMPLVGKLGEDTKHSLERKYVVVNDYKDKNISHEEDRFLRENLTMFIISQKIQHKELPDWLKKGVRKNKKGEFEVVEFLNGTVDAIAHKFPDSKYHEQLAHFVAMNTGGYEFVIKGNQLLGFDKNYSSFMQECLLEYNRQLEGNKGDTSLIAIMKKFVITEPEKERSDLLDNIKSQVEKDIELGLGVNLINKDGYTALMMTAFDRSKDKVIGNLLPCNGGNQELASLLLEKGADIHAKNDQGSTAFMIATHRMTSDKFRELLLNSGADINTQNNSGNTPLLYAVNSIDKDLVKFLIARGVDVNVRNNDKYTPLMLAALGAPRNIILLNSFASAEIVELLLEKGADITARNDKGNTALIIAENNNQDISAKILSAAEKGEPKSHQCVTYFVFNKGTNKAECVIQ